MTDLITGMVLGALGTVVLRLWLIVHNARKDAAMPDRDELP